ncbi:MAG: 2-C-methyl-D-erythritol 2,4-cyclodiphosphate synthase [Candidatus Omnitrophota bacterium]|nr:MAG: 2-C-methyl-D-erythritol 2,4-cyclodiphosphate synthase [Candidatus Omnitrophota bacterium]
MAKKQLRAGIGFDIHNLIKAKKDLILGAVKIPSLYSLKAVSDGDVVLHAICDAICGVACLGDIGDYFAPSSRRSKGISSKDIVKVILAKKKIKILNIDVTIITDKPKLVFYKRAMLKSLKKIFKVEALNLKIKSKEGRDFLGSKNAISCVALVLGQL